jgi:two-component system chemotaxis sensor kinase CheA
MDVVKTNIERIGGTIHLQNRPDRGTTVKITIPLTLAIIAALVVTVGNDSFAIPQVNLVELLSCGDASDKIEWVTDAPVYRLRGNLLPLVDLSQILELDQHSTENRKSTNVVVLQAEGRRFGLIVDQVIDTQEIVVKPLDRILRSIPMLAGATIMGDGSVVLILDVVGLARTAGIKLTKRDLPTVEAEPSQAETASQMFLLCESETESRVAIRLDEVHRLEEFRVDRVQRSASLEAVEYDGQIMPLVRLSKLLGWSQAATANSQSLNVVVHRQLGFNAGIVVPRIVDIVQSPHEIEQRSDAGDWIIGWTLIQGRVTEVIDLPRAFQRAGVRFAQQVSETT